MVGSRWGAAQLTGNAHMRKITATLLCGALWSFSFSAQADQLSGTIKYKIVINLKSELESDRGGKLIPMCNVSIFHRGFAGLSYTGRGLMIRVDRRSGTPEHIYTQAFNQNERINEATLTYRGKTCYVAKELIWANATNADLGAYFLYASDEEFLAKVVNPKCGWKLTLADLQ